MSTAETSLSRPRERLALAAIFAVALLLRVWGLAFGLPYVFHFDEHWHIKIASTLDPEMGIFPIFGTLQIALVAAHQLLTWIEPALRALSDSPELIATLDSPDARWHLAGRWMSAITGAATAPLLYLVGRDAWNRRVGLLAAAFMAVSFIHVRTSHFAVQDALVTFLTVCALVFVVRIRPGGPLAPYLGAGLFAGLAVAAKPLAWPVFVVLGAWHLFAEAPAEGRWGRAVGRRLIDWRIWLGGLLGVAATIACMPQIYLTWDATIAFWRMTAAAGLGGGYDRFALDPGTRPGIYLEGLLWGSGLALTLLGAAGVILAAVRFRERRPLLLLLFPLLYLAFLLKPGYFAVPRYMILMQPFLMLFAASALLAACGLIRAPRARAAVTAVAALVAIAQPLAASVKFDSLLAGEDTRILAKRWIEENLPEGTVIVREGERWSPPLQSPKEPHPFSQRTYRVFVKDLYGLSELSNMMGQFRGFATLDQYRGAGVQYLIANEVNEGMRLLDPEQDRQKRAFYETLEREAELVAEFSPYREGAEPIEFRNPHMYAPATHLWRLERNGPLIRIYRLDGPPGGGAASDGESG